GARRGAARSRRRTPDRRGRAHGVPSGVLRPHPRCARPIGWGRMGARRRRTARGGDGHSRRGAALPAHRGACRGVIDTHAHLVPAEAPAVLRRARAAGVERVVAVATTVAEAADTLALAEADDRVYACLGVHPHEAGDPGDLDELRRLLGHGRAVAVGETGLDYFRDYAPRDAQRDLFVRELALAEELGKPVVVHTRAADDDT